MWKLILALFAATWLTAPVAHAQVNFAGSQKLYAEARAALDAPATAAALRERAVPLLERLNTPRGWNNTADLYDLVQLVRSESSFSSELTGRLETHLRALLRAGETRLRNPDRDNLARYAEANRSVAPAAAGEQRVVFLGDSITDGWRLAEYFPAKPFVNRGISGQITGEMLGRMKADVLDLKPAAMVVLAGTNDLARGVDVQVVKNNLSMIGDLARANGIKVIFASILPVSDYAKDRPAQTPQRPPEKIRDINAWLQQHCREKGYTYLDYFSAMADDRGLLRAELANDGLHPNAAGYKIMAPLALAAIEQTLAKASKATTGARASGRRQR